MENLIGQSLGRYHILEALGEGGMATVYKAYDTRLEREVAIKVIRTDLFGSSVLERMLKRFEREAKVVAKLSHLHIIKVIDYGEHAGSPYLVMEYMPGGTLKQRLGKPMSWQEAVRILLPVAEALEYAHSHNIIHRDIKPANILLTERGQPMLTDFGIAKMLESEETATLTGTGIGIGTPEYMAPEQWTGQSTAQSDVYSLGIVLYEMVTGRKPYSADTPAAILLKQANEALPRPGKFATDLPQKVENILLKALAKNSKDRYHDIGEFAKALEGLTSGKATGQKLAAPRRDKAFVMPLRGVTIVQFMMLVLGLIAVFFKPLSSQLRATSTPDNTPTTVSAPILELAPTQELVGDGLKMVYISQGEFSMGSENGNSDELPIHIVFLDAYWIDPTEVTNAMYKKCVDAGVCNPPLYSGSKTQDKYYGNPEFDEHPVIYVNWDMARSYCEWVDKRLPTEAEWEKAVRGTDGRTYPWGEGIDCGKGNYNSSCVGDTSKVASYENGTTPSGIYDMAGNVSEWTNDIYSETYYQNSPFSNPFGINSGQLRVLRGGSWSGDNDSSRAASRSKYNSVSAGADIGFRCVQSVASP